MASKSCQLLGYADIAAVAALSQSHPQPPIFVKAAGSCSCTILNDFDKSTAVASLSRTGSRKPSSLKEE